MNYFIQFLIAMTATITFAILFSVPKQELPLCGLVGALEWVVYYAIVLKMKNVVLGSLTAAFVLTIFCRITAVLRQNPATVYFLPGIFPLVPGAGIYYTASYLIFGKKELFAAKGLETFEIALAIVFGIIFGFSIPEALFHKREKNKKQEES